MGQLVFDRSTAEKLEAAYRARDIVRRRQLVHAALAPKPGERILDVGCGPGFYVQELLGRVGEAGSVTGVDRSPQMLALAAERCSGHENVAFAEGDATSLPVASGELDAAISIQVLEYVTEVDTALAELHRALRSGGRVVVWDVDWSALSWHSDDPARMARVLAAWDRHLAHPALPRTLAGRLRKAGFDHVAVEGHAFVAGALSPETYAGAVFPLLEEFVASTGELAREELDAWAREQRALSERGEFYFASTQVCFTATRT